MTVRINTNSAALNTHRNVVNNSRAQAKNLEKLSSGLKINRAADAPAALNISEQLRAQTASLKQAIDNTCLLYTSPSPRDRTRSRMPSSA